MQERKPPCGPDMSMRPTGGRVLSAIPAHSMPPSGPFQPLLPCLPSTGRVTCWSPSEQTFITFAPRTRSGPGPHWWSRVGGLPSHHRTDCMDLDPMWRRSRGVQFSHGQPGCAAAAHRMARRRGCPKPGRVCGSGRVYPAWGTDILSPPVQLNRFYRNPIGLPHANGQTHQRLRISMGHGIPPLR